MTGSSLCVSFATNVNRMGPGHSMLGPTDTKNPPAKTLMPPFLSHDMNLKAEAGQAPGPYVLVSRSTSCAPDRAVDQLWGSKSSMLSSSTCGVHAAHQKLSSHR
jgi:hypothetical protein